VDLRYLTPQELAPLLGSPPGIEELKIARCGAHPTDNVPDAVRLAYYNCTEGIQAEDSRIGAAEYLKRFAAKSDRSTGNSEQEQPEPKGSFWYHNGSLMHLVVNAQTRRFYYENPRPGLKEEGVNRGTLLFDGVRDGKRYVGKAFIFRCGRSFEYEVNGPISRDEHTVTLHGKAPRVDDNCNRIGERDDELVFTYEAISRPLSSSQRETRGD
jgi:hypothetical protein